MPAFVGPVQVEEIEQSAIFTVGDAFILSPKSSGKGSFGAGAANSGDFIEMNNLFSITSFDDVDLLDQINILNK